MVQYFLNRPEKTLYLISSVICYFKRQCEADYRGRTGQWLELIINLNIVAYGNFDILHSLSIHLGW